MCCLFGIIDYQHSLTERQKRRMLSALAAAAEVRGTDATGIAYNTSGTLRIYKRPIPGRWMRFRVPEDVRVVMGHTRMATQGNAKKNYNNHPFRGSTQGKPFALAHNGVLYNDGYLRRSRSLPRTKIETDSYVAVQLVEQKRALNFDSLRYMAEQVKGSYTFTALDQRNNLYIVKGDSPMCLYHFPEMGLYLYASTEEVLEEALHQAQLICERPERVAVTCGHILRIDAAGQISRSNFDDSNLSWHWYPFLRKSESRSAQISLDFEKTDSHLDEIKSVAMMFGYSPEDIDRLSAQGFTPEELEELLYCGEL